MTVIIDYGVGNLFSLLSSLKFIGEDAVVTRDPATVRAAERVILPGVGAFGDAADKLRETGMFGAVIDFARTGKPLLGICLGMQMLLTRSHEFGLHDGLDLIPGEVKPIKPLLPPDYKVPQIGWNALRFMDGVKSPLFKYNNGGDHVYFVHSYSAQDCGAYITATTEYGADLVASVERGNVFGTQFHPEKSGEVGLKMLRAFCEM